MVAFFRSPLAASLPALPPPQAGDDRPVFPIGYTSVSHPPKRPFGLPTPTRDGRPVLEVKDVEWSLFYPCEVPEAPAQAPADVPWVVGPLSSVVRGYSRFLGISKHILSISFSLLVAYPQTVLPDVHRNARARPPAAGRRPWPLLVFSHGLGGGKHVYSQLCRYYASRGFCVLVVQHKDGTGPATFVRDHTSGDETELLYIRNDELSGTPPPTMTTDDAPAPPDADDKIPLRRAQLQVRQAEVYEAFAAFASLARGGDETSSSGLLFEEGFASGDWAGKVDVEQIHLGGHSFGGATALHVLSNPPPDGLPKLPVRSVLLLDPWLDPLPPVDDPRLADTSLPPALFVNSEGFTLWTGHFDRLAAIARQWGGGSTPSCWGTTVLRSEHQSFSDFPLLLPTLPGLPFATAPKTTATPDALLGAIARVSETFLATGSPAGARELAAWDGACDDGHVAVDETPRAKGWLRRGGEEPKSKRVMRGIEGEVRVHFRGGSPRR